MVFESIKNIVFNEYKRWRMLRQNKKLLRKIELLLVDYY